MPRRPKTSNKAKIIVRNLPFKNLSEKSLEDVFKEYGDIKEVKILRKNDGKFVGCGFIKFAKAVSAAKAIRNCNLKEINGRKIIVDWALPKNKYLEKLQEFNAVSCNGIKSEELSIDENNVKKHESEDEEMSDESESNKEDYESNEESYESSEEDSLESEDDEDSQSETKSESNIPNFKKKEISSNKNCLSGRSNDVNDGKTLFIRNVPFSTTNEDLKNTFLKYGPLEYALVCVDKLTEHSKGTAFVKFKEKSDALNCLKDSTKLFLQENPLTITVAVSKESLEHKKKTKKVKDSRNLYLIREGVIVAGSKAAAGLSASDMAKRLQLEQWKTQILKNLNMFISKTRLIIHNLPPSYDDAKLKQLFAKHSNPKAIIKEAKVMYDKKKLNSSNKGISKEYGFVSFTNHEDALIALRNINNNPNIFTPNRRPIVAFSIENKAVINAKQKNIEKSRSKLGISTSDSLSKLNRKQRRFIKRRQKIIEKRREAKRLKLGEPNSTLQTEGEVEKSSKRKREEKLENKSNKRIKVKELNSGTSSSDPSSFAGIISKAGEKVKVRSRFKLKTQAKIHSQTIKMRRRVRREKERKKMKPIKQEKQKKGKPKLMDDEKLSKLIKKHRESIQNVNLSKWYQK